MSSSRLAHSWVWACFFTFPVSLSAQQTSWVGFAPDRWFRHDLQLLVDAQSVDLPTTQWPLPHETVRRALLRMRPSARPELIERKIRLLEKLSEYQTGKFEVNLKESTDGLVGYGDEYVPGSSLRIASKTYSNISESHEGVSAKIAVSYEGSSNSLQTQWQDGLNAKNVYRIVDSSMAFQNRGWVLQAFARPTWWGPGWQSSLIESHNHPQWLGVGVQTTDWQPFEHNVLRKLGPWSLDVFVAQAQDPVVTTSQPDGYVYSGARLTFKPYPWVEVGLSRGMQTMGAGRPSGLDTFLKAFLGQEVNEDPDSNFEDSSSQISGYDLRLSCVQPWMGDSCAAYAQLMGEDAAGNPPLPYKFMYLFGAETTFNQGRYRLWVEHASTHTHRNGFFQTDGVGYLNGHYPQGFTNGARWIGASQGGGSRLTSVGIIDSSTKTSIKIHWGNVGISLGAYVPNVNAPRSGFRALEWQREWQWSGWIIAPNFYYHHFDTGADFANNSQERMTLGLRMSLPLK